MRPLSGGDMAFFGFGEKKGFTLVEIAIVAAIFLLVVVVLSPFIHLVKDWAQVVSCTHNLRQISLGLHAYANDHNGLFPASLKELYPEYVKNKNFFSCPGAKHFRGGDEAAYEYTAGLTRSSKAATIIVQDRGGNHANSGKNILKINGSLEWVRSKKDI